jgi:hypothetical protein
VPKEMTIEDIKQTVLDFKTEQKMLLLQDLMVLNCILPTVICCNSFLMAIPNHRG